MVLYASNLILKLVATVESMATSVCSVCVQNLSWVALPNQRSFFSQFADVLTT